MKEAVQKILETEKEVRESIERARSDAQAIVHGAEEKSRAVRDEVRQNAMHEAQEILERLKREAEEARRRQVDAARGHSSDLVAKKVASIETAARRVTDFILGIDTKQGELFEKGGSR